MAHQLELNKDGSANMFSGQGIVPWHGLGTVIEGKATAEEALKLAGLDWNVDLRQLHQPVGDKFVPVPDRFATVRETDDKVLGIVSANYHVYQNIEAFAFLNKLTDSSEHDAIFTTAGSLLGGSRTFMTLQIGEEFMVAGEDAHKLYLMATNSHDGSQAFTCAVTAIRAVCANTVTLGLAQAKSKWTIKHKTSLEGKAQDARDVLEMSFRYEDHFQKLVEEMIDITVTKDKMFQLADKIVPKSPRQHDISVEELMAIWENEPTCQMGAGDTDNGWKAFNAVTYWTDHKEYRTPESRFNSIIGTGVGTGLGEKMRPAAQKLILAMA